MSRRDRQIGSCGGQANCLDNLGGVAHALGRLDHAVEHLTRALALHRAIGDRYGEAYNQGCLAAVHADAGRTAHALDLAHAALVLARETGTTYAETRALLGLAAEWHAGHHPVHRTTPCRTLALFAEIGSPDADQIRALLDP